MNVGRSRDVLEAFGRPLRRLNRAASLIGVLGAVATVFALAAWMLRSGWGPAWSWALGAWVGSAALAVLLFRQARRNARALDAGALARHLEESGTLRHGALLSLLDHPADGTSPGLVRLADETTATLLLRDAPALLEPLARRVRRRLMSVGGGLAVAVTALAAASPGRGPVRVLWTPREAIGLLLAPVSLEAWPQVVDRGGRVTLRMTATGQRSAVLWSRAAGQPWTSTPVSLDTAGQGTQVIASVQSDLFFRLSSGRRSSDTLAVRIRLPAFLGGLRVVARYPRYLRLEDETLPTGGDTLLIPAGTVLETEGEASVPLASAAWVREGRPAPLTVEGRRFRGRLGPPSSGSWVLSLRTEGGERLDGDPVRLPVELVPDSAPRVEVPVPGADTIASLDLRIPLVVDARDDHGLSRVELVSRSGRDSGPVITTLELGSPEPDRALLETTLDLARRGLGPGDTVRYFVRALDNNPAGQVGRSREYLVIVPTGAVQRDAQRQATVDARKALDSLVASSRQLERQTEDLARERQREGLTSRPDPSMAFEDAKRAESVARSQEDLVRRAEELQQTLEALRQASERGEAPDSALARRLAEVSAQLDKALSPELRRRLAELQRSLKELDPQATQDALKQLAEVQEALRQALERSRDLFKRAALEGELGTLARDAKDMAQAQREWNDRLATADSAAAAAEQRQLAGRADSLASNLARAAQDLEQEPSKPQVEASASEAKQAAQQMQSAASAVQRGQRREARARGEEARSAMEQVGRQTEQQQQRQQEAWRQEVLDALDRALAETARLSRAQLDVAEAFRRGTLGPARNEQGLAEEGVQKVIDQVAAVSGKNALVSPQILVALAVARRQMGLAREAVSSGSPSLRDAADQAGEAVDALNVAAFQMVRTRDDVAGSSSGSGLAEAMARMAQMAQQQGKLNQQAAGLMPMAGSSAAQMQLQSLAAQQRALAQELERMRAQGQVPGTQEMSEEARELARRLEASRLDRETTERQERLFRRMLDAGRTLEGEERDEKKERQSTTARPGEIRLPPALRDRMGTAGVRFPAWDQLQRLSPEERRLVTEYFRRLAGSGSP